MASPAITAQGTVIAYSDGGSPSSFTNIPGVSGLRGLGMGQPRINDISDLDSTAVEKMLGLIDEGTVNGSINVNHANAVHAALRAARAARTRLEFKMTFANGKIAQFFGYVTQFGSDVNTGDALRGQLTIEIDGIVSYT